MLYKLNKPPRARGALKLIKLNENYYYTKCPLVKEQDHGSSQGSRHRVHYDLMNKKK